ncbi:MAG: hypothetical protein GWP08_11130 [Nitrospiraceae bacterium]|nr:hypothetical protein [Nitrospiraceae bacterium]
MSAVRVGFIGLGSICRGRHAPGSQRIDGVETWRVERDFIDAIRTGAEYHPNFEDGMRYTQVVQAVHDSSAQGQAVQLD